MVVYNTRTKSTREVEIVPSTSWGGNGLLGVSIKHTSFDQADERVWHVIEVEPGSPAQQAGFIANEDYVIGSDSILQENDDLFNLVAAHEGKALKLFVYNAVSDNCREVICHPNSKWGGKGFLGCEFGHGLLHRIPYGRDETESDKPGTPLLTATRQTNQTNPLLYREQMMQQQIHQLQKPGQQLLQQSLAPSPAQPQGLNAALSQQNTVQPATVNQTQNTDQRFPAQSNQQESRQNYQHNQSSQQSQQTYNSSTNPMLPQTFAQLASSQYQTPQYPPLQSFPQYQPQSNQQYPRADTQYQQPPLRHPINQQHHDDNQNRHQPTHVSQQLDNHQLHLIDNQFQQQQYRPQQQQQQHFQQQPQHPPQLQQPPQQIMSQPPPPPAPSQQQHQHQSQPDQQQTLQTQHQQMGVQTQPPLPYDMTQVANHQYQNQQYLGHPHGQQTSAPEIASDKPPEQLTFRSLCE